MKKRRDRGQISILIVLTIIPIFTLFAFVVNIGMLVNAKIALQNAADLAAYAGAATQARQLTHISYLNYQMRQAYKKFLFKYYVIGNMSMRCFPRNKGGPSEANCRDYGGTVRPDNADFEFINPDRAGSTLPGVPSVCLSLAPESNPCQLGKSVPIVKSPTCFPLDPICGALKSSTDAIAEVQKKSCAANSLVNQELLILWLYATDNQNELKTQVNLQGLANDIGLVVENAMHFERIETIRKEYINAPPQGNVNSQTVNTLQQAQDQAVNERTILAFRTAVGNLNENVFTRSSVTMSELMPASPEMLQLDVFKPKFSVFYTEMEGSDSKECKLQLGKFDVQPILGVYKKPSIDTPDVYYAVKLTARARILFNPFPFGSAAGDIEMTAYSAASPFGSRIGPELRDEDFVANGPANGTPARFPDIKMGGANDAAATIKRVGVLRDFYLLIHGDGNGTATLSADDFNRGMDAALLPEEYEVGRYNMPVNSEKNFVDYTTLFSNDTSPGGDYSFWAPLISPGTGLGVTDLKEKIKKIMEENISSSQTQQSQASQVSNLLIQKADGYLARLKARGNFNVAKLRDPLTLDANKSVLIPDFKLRDVKKLASSYTSDHNIESYSQGRDGYSVKYIPFRTITAKLAPFARQDAGNIKH